MPLGRIASCGFVAAFVLVGCGSSGGSEFGDGNGNGSSGGNGDPLATFGTSSDGGGGGAADGPAVGNVGGVTPGSACATASAGSTRPPTYLVVMYDRSISMGDAVGSTTKWAACKTALEGFFAASSSTGIHASLTFFGKDAKSSTADCSASSYVTPDVAMGALPNGTSYATAINATSPSTDTPTLAAEQGAIQYAQQVKGGLKANEKVAIVLVTDGDPLFCGTGNTVTAVANAASAVASTIPTYVVGIGSSLTNLNTIAKAGGTTAILVSTSSPSQLTTDLEKALGSIATAQLGCEYPFPSPPAGQSLDVNAVNVDYTPSSGAQTTLNYSADCGDANGWHYDSTASPTQIIMCPSLCSTLKADPAGKVDIIFGCTTAIPPGGSPPVR